MEAKDSRQTVKATIENHPDATLRSTTSDDALSFRWDGANDIGFYEALLEEGWAVTSTDSVHSLRSDEGPIIWVEPVDL